METTRRTFLKATLAVGTVGLALGAGLLTPRSVMAAWPESAFKAESPDAAMQALEGSSAMDASDKITVAAPDIAENGAVVSVGVTTTLPNPESISILAEKNAFPLAASFKLHSEAEGEVTTRIKMAKTANVIAVVKSGGKLYTAKKSVKVTLGGCGG